MFKTKCKRCGSKISKSFDFCPYCGNKTARQREGLLDEVGEFEEMGDMDKIFSRGLGSIGGFGGFGFGMINNLAKQIEKEFRELDKQLTKPAEKKEKIPSKVSRGISISINTATGREPIIKVSTFGDMPGAKKIEKELKPVMLKEAGRGKSEIVERISKISKLPKEEAVARVRRLSNKIIYEIDLPGITNIKDIFINKLENSIEIRAFTNDKAYFKLIPISLPLKKYYLEDEKLILELLPRE